MSLVEKLNLFYNLDFLPKKQFTSFQEKVFGSFTKTSKLFLFNTELRSKQIKLFSAKLDEDFEILFSSNKKECY